MVTTFSERTEVLLERFDRAPLNMRTQRFMSAGQAPSADIRYFATTIQVLAWATVSDEAGSTAERKQVKHDLPREEMKSHFVHWLRDPVRRFVMSRNSQDFDSAIDCAVQEESNESPCSDFSGIPRVDENQRQSDSDAAELKRRLENNESSFSRRVHPGQQRGQRVFLGQRFRGSTGHLVGH
ncbi:hypothetical protein HPB48_010112 [Haemaphysalis longicornis]|uniref:Uncharacterized protein n=1 Tax=Haemaphysalis longicornis TaxID=44386 RepID=A0A9J6FLS3_HAELO|nr:hypothetical protein HPB48_010112 [Haemaphysalis longicornis]